MSRIIFYPAEVREPVAMRLELLSNNGEFRPLEALHGRLTWDGEGRERLRAIEVSVLWYTDGKGDEDMEVHFFRRIEVEGPEGESVARPIEFDVELPASPLSYEGQIVKIYWCARARVFPAKGNQIVLERRFWLRSPAP